MAQSQTADDEAQTDDPFAHFRGKFDDDTPLEELWTGDQYILKNALKTAIKENAERIQGRQQLESWDGNPALDDVASDRNRQFAKMYHRLTEAMD